MIKWLLAGIALAVIFVSTGSPGAIGAGRYSDEVYDNLQRTRDALLGQRDELNKRRSDVLGQIDHLNQKLNRIDQYLKQVTDSIHDVDDALNKF